MVRLLQYLPGGCPRLSGWLNTYRDRRFLILLALGFCSGLPAPLVFSNLSIWLNDVGISRTDIGLLALATTPYALNFLWAPLLDRYPLPWVSAWLGQRRSWILFSQLLLLLALALLSLVNPAAQLYWVVAGVLLVSILSATQDIAVDAYRIELLEPEQYGAGSAVAIWGWHLGGTLVGGAGGLYLAHHFGWNMAYLLLALAVLIGVATTLICPEPVRRGQAEAAQLETSVQQKVAGLRGLSEGSRRFLGWLSVHLGAPLLEFTRRRGWLWILLFIFVFKLGDALLGRMSGVFYRQTGFSLTEIAEVAKVYGLAANIAGVVLGGILVTRIGLLRALLASGLAAAMTNLTYAWLAASGQSYWVFVVAVISDNFTGGLVMVAFVAYLSSLCHSAYTATQYALLSSLGNLARILLSASSGWMVDQLQGNWVHFFLLTTLIALAGLPLLWVLMRFFPAADTGNEREPSP